MMIDYLRDPVTNALLIKNGDFVRDECTNQHQRNLLLAEKGAYKQYPEIGVGLMSFLKDENPGDLLREIRLQFSADGMDVKSVGFDNGMLKIIAPYGQ